MGRILVIGAAIAAAGLTGAAVGASGVLGRGEAIAAPSPMLASVEPASAPVIAPPIQSDPLPSRAEVLKAQLQGLNAERVQRLKDGRLKPPPPPVRTQPRPAKSSPSRRPDTAVRTVSGAPAGFVGGDDLRCMTEAIYYEARSESEAGQRAVAQVILNRLSDPRYPQSVCGVVYEHKPGARTCQFSFTCDGSMNRGVADQAAWSRAQRFAEDALSGAARSDTVATHYHTDYVAPRWSRAFQEVARIGAHIFYDGRGDRDPK